MHFYTEGDGKLMKHLHEPQKSGKTSCPVTLSLSLCMIVDKLEEKNRMLTCIVL